MNQHPDFEQYIDDDGYSCFNQHEGLPAPGLWWTKHQVGWQCFIDDPNVLEPIYTTGDDFPNKDELEEVKNFYLSLLKVLPKPIQETYISKISLAQLQEVMSIIEEDELDGWECWISLKCWLTKYEDHATEPDLGKYVPEEDELEEEEDDEDPYL